MCYLFMSPELFSFRRDSLIMMLISWRMLSYFVVGKRHCYEDNALVNGIDVLCLKVFACSSRSQCSSRHSLASQGRQWTTISQNTLHLVILSSNLPTSFFSARIVCKSERRDSSLLCNCYCVYGSWINASQVLITIWISHTYFIRICILIMPKQQYLQPSILQLIGPVTAQTLNILVVYSLRLMSAW